MYSLSFSVFAITLVFGGLALALPYPADDAKAINSARSANTCADPSLLQTVVQTFVPGLDVHGLNFLFAFENFNTATNDTSFTDIHPAFRAWPTQQDFTVPLFQLETADASQVIYRIGVDANTPPVVSGFDSFVALIGWVYGSQVCGSVPLMSAVQARFTDHYFTTNQFEHDGLITDGWTDGGVVAFVIPLPF